MTPAMRQLIRYVGTELGKLDEERGGDYQEDQSEEDDESDKFTDIENLQQGKRAQRGKRRRYTSSDEVLDIITTQPKTSMADMIAATKKRFTIIRLARTLGEDGDIAWVQAQREQFFDLLMTDKYRLNDRKTYGTEYALRWTENIFSMFSYGGIAHIWAGLVYAMRDGNSSRSAIENGRIAARHSNVTELSEVYAACKKDDPSKGTLRVVATAELWLIKCRLERKYRRGQDTRFINTVFQIAYKSKAPRTTEDAEVVVERYLAATINKDIRWVRSRLKMAQVYFAIRCISPALLLMIPAALEQRYVLRPIRELSHLKLT